MLVLVIAVVLIPEHMNEIRNRKWTKKRRVHTIKTCGVLNK
jgi:hypothetical protein